MLSKEVGRSLAEIRAAFQGAAEPETWEISTDLTVVELLHLKEMVDNEVQKENAKRKKSKKLQARRKNAPKKPRR